MKLFKDQNYSKMQRFFDLSAYVKPAVRFQSLPAYQVCGYAGLGLAVLLALVLMLKLNLSAWALLGITVAGICTFLFLAMVTKIISGRESLIYYHHEIAILLVAAGLLRILHQPVLPYLDITLLGIGTFLFCGRIGCLMVGCCHGKPHDWGVCYTEEHRNAGFTPYLVGVKLFPVQLLEALFVLFVVIVGTMMVLSRSYRPGEAFVWYVIFYGAARFYFEFLRGDPDRPYIAGFSEAQWTSLLLMSLAIWAEWKGALPFHLWHGGVTASVALTMIVSSVIRHRQSSMRSRILHPCHIREVAEAVDLISAGDSSATRIPLCCTSIGIRISKGVIDHEGNRVCHYSVSSAKSPISEKTVSALSVLIVKLRHPLAKAKVVKGNQGVFHVLISAEQEVS